MEEQRRFLTCYDEVGHVLLAFRCAKVSRSAHYDWLEQDPTYGPRFQAARLRACRYLEDEALRRAKYGVVKASYKRKPVEGEPLYENKFSDHLMIELLAAGDPDRFNREKAAPFDGNFDTLTERQITGLLGWLKQAIKTAKIQMALTEPGRQPETDVAGAEGREAERTGSPAPIGFIGPTAQMDGRIKS
jgi:hypothetical protein